MKAHDRPVVSVVMSVFNGEADLERSLQSILDQTFTDFEFIIINDGSTDQSASILEKYAAQDNRIQVHIQENQGLTKALMTGCSLARGEFIARQDADDFSIKSRIYEQVSLLSQNQDIGFVSCFTVVEGPKGEFINEIRRTTNPDSATENLIHAKQGLPAHGSVMFRKCLYEDVGGYRAAFYFAQDSDLWLRMAQRSKFGYVPLVLYKLSLSEKSISSTSRVLQARFGELGQSCLKTRLDGLSEEPFLNEAVNLSAQIRSASGRQPTSKRQLAGFNYFIGRQLVGSQRKQALTYLIKAIKLNPIHLKAWVFVILILLNSDVGRNRVKDGVSQ